MKVLHFTRPVNLPLLTEQLFETFPEWIYRSRLGSRMTDVAVTATEVIFPETTDESRVQAVIDAHNEKDKSRNQRKKEDDAKKVKELKDEVKNATTVDDLKNALLALLGGEP